MSDVQSRSISQSEKRQRQSRRRQDNEPSSLECEPALSLEKRIQDLVAAMHSCVEKRQRVNLSVPPHRETTEALHRLVYELGDQAILPIEYDDSLSSEPFPVRGLRLPAAPLTWREDQAVHIGTLTYRHVEYDDYVDLYLIRDRETRNLNSAGIESLACKRMLEILSDPLLATEAYVAVYQTGLEPLVVGVYRAVVEDLQRRRREGLGQLSVRPVFFPRGAGRTGTLWG
jgi:hypothetical protein